MLILEQLSIDSCLNFVGYVVKFERYCITRSWNIIRIRKLNSNIITVRAATAEVCSSLGQAGHFAKQRYNLTWPLAHTSPKSMQQTCVRGKKC